MITGLLAAVLGGLTVASTAAAQEPPVFYIEKIHVEAPRLSPEIVLSESLLEEGREYSEAQLREAVHRIHRLPFVLLAEFSLRKGSERGRYELVVTIYEARRWFFQFGGDWALEDDIARIDPRGDSFLWNRIGETVDDVRGLVGRRFALGKKGLLFASFGAEEGTFALGYQHYDLFDRNILLSMSVGGLEEFGDVMFSDSSWGASTQLGIPIKGNHALRILVAHSQYDYRFFNGQEITSRDSEAEIAWVFNSLDDPVLPRGGLLLEGGVSWSEIDDTRITLDPGGELVLDRFIDNSNGVLLAASRHWPVADRQSVSLGARGYFEEGGADERWETEASVGHQVFLMRRQEVGKWRELRLETEASQLSQDFSSTDPYFSHLDRVDSWALRAGLVYRNGWGLYRFSFTYLDRNFR